MPLFHTPVLWANGCIALIAIGALANSALIDTGGDRALHDTYVVVSHFYYVYSLALVFGFFAVWYFLFPRVAGNGYSHLLGNVHFWLSVASVGALLTPHALIAATLGESAVDARDVVRLGSLVALVGSFLSAAGFLVFLANMVLSVLRRPAR
jgi:cytochrome c oxidase subunit 1